MVGRGETLASVAAKCQTTVEALKEANPYMTNIYVGMEVKIPAAVNTPTVSSTTTESENKPEAVLPSSAYEENISRPAQAYINFAEDYIKALMHKKAIKELNKSLEIQDTRKARWLRGKCYYAEQKWKKAIEDLDYIRNNQNVDPAIRSEAENLYNSAYGKRELVKEERAEFWGKVGAGVVLAAALVGTAALANEQNKANGASLNSSSSTYSSDSSPTVSSGAPSSRMNQIHQDAYKKQESLVESLYNTLTGHGGYTINKSGDISGSTSKNLTKSPGAHSISRNSFYQRQKRLKEIRMEAEREGVTIIPSKWETATVD